MARARGTSRYGRVATAATIVASLAALLPTSAAAQFVSATDEFLLNTYTAGHQMRPSAVGLPDGGFVVVWQNDLPSGFFPNTIERRQYDASSTPLGPEGQLNTTPLFGDTEDVLTAASPDGSSVVVWQRSLDISNENIKGQLLDSSGDPAGSEFDVSPEGWLRGVARAADGSFVVVHTDVVGTADKDLLARHFASDGTATGPAVLVNSHTTGHQDGGAIAALDDGSFVVVWNSNVQDGDGNGVFARRLDTAGALLGSEFQMNVRTTGDQGGASVAALSSGDFVVAWQDEKSYGHIDITARRFSSTGAPAGTEFQVNAPQTGAIGQTSVAGLPDGSYLIAWQGPEPPLAEPIVAKRLAADDSAIGAEFLVNAYTATQMYIPRIATMADGGFAIFWSGWLAPDGHGDAAFGRRFCVNAVGADDDGDGVPNQCDKCPGAEDGDDADGDGAPDECDLCTNVGGARDITLSPRLRLARPLVFQGDFDVATSFAALAPATTGARFLAKVQGGRTALDLLAPPGAFDGLAGWVTNAAGTRHTFLSKVSETAPRLKIIHRTTVGAARVRIRLRVRDPDLSLSLSHDHHNASISIGDPAAGECGETVFTEGDCNRSLPRHIVACSQ